MTVEMDSASKGVLGGFAVLTLGSGLVTLVYGVLLLLRYMGIEFNYGIFNVYTISIVLIVVGGLLILTLLLGVLGAVKDQTNLRMFTLVLLFLLFAVLAILGVWTMVSFKTGQLQRSIELDIQNLNDNYDKNTPALKNKADYLNTKYNCCGSYSNYDAKVDGKGIPESCCIVKGCAADTLNNEAKYFPKGCASVYFNTKSGVVFNIAIVALATAGAVLLALVFYLVVYQRARAGYAAVSRG